MDITWVLKSFDELTVHEMYAILKLRIEVFIVEQNCAFQDADDKDQKSYHLTAWCSTQLLAYSRIVPPGISYKFSSIGRIATSPTVRKKGIGKMLIQESINKTENLFGKNTIQIGAQLYLKKIYESFEFVQSSDTYVEDGINHIEMMREV